ATVAVVIPVFNRKEFTRDCLISLAHQTRPADYIVIVDDGSTDGTQEMIRNEFPETIIIEGDGNLFWTAAINLGIRRALNMGVDYVLTLNNDTVASSAFIENMLAATTNDNHALIGALDVDMKTKKPYYGGEYFDWKTGKSTYLLDVLPAAAQRGLHEVSLFPGRGLLIPRKVFDAIGLFEQKKLPHYMADYDFTLMAKRYGFRMYCNYDAVLYTYPSEGGDHKLRKRKSLKNYFDHLFGIKGGGNLRNFTIYTFRNCPSREILPALLSGYARRIGGYWIK
ncbi:MAG TPA: glycosyltransferase family 2 protein, partial [Cyclobacteriaceae bacterium]|nr:glycosyltransferase family 2 protein [Cyclobacteriaceae bacterium]